MDTLKGQINVMVSTEEERSAVSDLRLTIDGQDYTSNQKLSQDCSHSATVSAAVPVQTENVNISYELRLSSGQTVKKLCILSNSKYFLVICWH